MSVQRGTRLIVFDAVEWNNKDVGDNSQFYKPATVERVYFREGDGYMVDVIFDHRPESVSLGHFLRATRSI